MASRQSFFRKGDVPGQHCGKRIVDVLVVSRDASSASRVEKEVVGAEEVNEVRKRRNGKRRMAEMGCVGRQIGASGPFPEEKRDNDVRHDGVSLCMSWPQMRGLNCAPR